MDIFMSDSRDFLWNKRNLFRRQKKPFFISWNAPSTPGNIAAALLQISVLETIPWHGTISIIIKSPYNIVGLSDQLSQKQIPLFFLLGGLDTLSDDMCIHWEMGEMQRILKEKKVREIEFPYTLDFGVGVHYLAWRI